MKKMRGFFIVLQENPRLIKTFSSTNAMKIKTMIPKAKGGIMNINNPCMDIIN